MKASRMAAGCCLMIGGLLWSLTPANGSHDGQGHGEGQTLETHGAGHSVPGAPFQVFVQPGQKSPLDPAESEAALRTVVGALSFLIQHRAEYPRFDEAVKKEALEAIVIEPTVVNQEGKEFPFLVARTAQPGRVKLLISASFLKRNGYLEHPDSLAPGLAKEFQWVVSKADTSPKPRTIRGERDLARAPVRAETEILKMSGQERVSALHQLFETYLTTVDDQQSLLNQPYYEVGAATVVPPAQPDSTIKLYDIRVREALQQIVQEPYFLERTPKAVKSLLNGKVWNVSFVKVDQRDWATRTRVAPEDQSVSVGKSGLSVQPAKILVNVSRTAATDDPFYAETKGLPMGALSVDQLARVIAWEIERNIVEKSMTGHVAQDAMTAPR